MIAAVLLASAFTAPAVPSDYVTDKAGALSVNTAASIRDELRAYQRDTGNRVIVYIDQTTGGVPLEDWTVQTAHAWKIGAKGKDNGAILFLFMADHKVRIEVGYGLESSLTDAQASRIIRDTIVPRIRAGDVNGAVRGGVDGMLTTITPSFTGTTDSGESATQPAPAEQRSNWWAENGAWIFIFGVWAIVLLFGFRKRRGNGLTVAGSGVDDGSSRDDGGGSFSGGGDFGGGGASGSW